MLLLLGICGRGFELVSLFVPAFGALFCDSPASVSSGPLSASESCVSVCGISTCSAAGDGGATTCSFKGSGIASTGGICADGC